MKPYPRKNDTVSVLGLGRSGMAVIEHFCARGVRVYAYDDGSASALGERAHRLRELGVPLYAEGKGELRGDFVFRSPAVRPDTPRLCRAALRGAVVLGEAEYFAMQCPAPIYAVTGSDGKTTTATMLAALLESTGRRVYLGGNIGRSLLPFLDEITEDDACVLELSSFQLMDMEASFHTAVITNLTPNHLNWHRDMAEYTAAKRRLAALSARCVLKAGLFAGFDAVRFSALRAADYRLSGDLLLGRGVPLCRRSEMLATGLHNVENLLAASAAAEDQIKPAAIAALARRFEGAPHRMELLKAVHGVRFYNSSIDTTPSRTAATLAAIEERERSLSVLCGGAEKGLSFAPLADALAEAGARVYLFGAAEEAIASALREKGITYTACGKMENAVKTAFSDAKAGDAILLSPACTSFDAFVDFEARGEAFRRLVAELAET